MAGSKSDFLENELLDHVLSAAAYTAPATLYVGLWGSAALSDSATGSTAGELAYTGYARVAVTNNVTNFPAASGGSKNNGTDITFGQNTGGSTTAYQVGICDAATNGNLLYWADLSASKTINTGDTPKFLASTGLTFTED